MGYVSKWTKIYVDKELEGLLLGYKGKSGYLSEMQNQAINTWLQSKNYWHLRELQEYIEDEYNVVFESKQSYYAIFEKAGISWKKTQKYNPKGDCTIIQKKEEIRDWLEKHREEIIAEKLVVFFADECHLLCGDTCGYVWEKKQERIEIPIINEKERQTYYGAVNLYIQECVIQATSAGNSESTVAFLKYLQSQNEYKRIAIIWDGASYHRSQEVKDYLALTNLALDESGWKITCIRFAPNDPKQNPIEDIWLQLKRFICEFYHLCTSFATVKFFFEFVSDRRIKHIENHKVEEYPNQSVNDFNEY